MALMTAPAPTARLGEVDPWPLWARLVQLLVGLVMYGVSAALLVRSDLGLDPWDVFHQGLSRQTGLSIGTWVIIVGVAVLLLWIPLRQRPGIGTLSNAVLIGLTMNVVLDRFPQPHAIGVRWACLVGGILLCGVATGAYIGAGLGPGPRDGLMVGLAKRGHSLRLMRTLIEITVLLVGFVLGGTVGIGTLLFAVSIGPLAHLTIPWFSRVGRTETGPSHDRTGG
jgi:uncharacterized membrane protein YczE